MTVQFTLNSCAFSGLVFPAIAMTAIFIYIENKSQLTFGWAKQ
jgi:hypothetical protein